jgi:MFS superfamily sulfate permease-like transporter
VLAALIIHAVSHLWKVAEMRRYYTLQRLEFWLALATLLGVITIDVLPGLVIGVVAKLLLAIYHATRPRVGSLGRVPGEPGHAATVQTQQGDRLAGCDARDDRHCAAEPEEDRGPQDRQGVEDCPVTRPRGRRQGVGDQGNPDRAEQRERPAGEA